MNDESGINKDSIIETSTAFERWELPALLEQEEIDKEARLVEQLPTLEEIEKIRADAYEEGFKVGKKQGVKDGLKDGEKLTQQKITTLVSGFSQPLQQQDDRLEKVLLDMTLQLTKAIIRRELCIDSGAVTQVILEVFDYVETEEGKFRVQLNPADVKGVAYFLEKEYPGEANYQLISDNQISQGGCIIRSDAHYVDAQIETQIDKLLDEVYSQKNTAPVETLEDQPVPPNEVPAEKNGTDGPLSRDNESAEDVARNNRSGVLSASEAENAQKVDLSSMPFFDSENNDP
jgi:flagellar assembly protein FliH